MSHFKYEPAVPGLHCIHQGKVRDTFAIPEYPELLLTVATDRVSTHNIVHESTIPNKGQALTALTVFWMKEQLPGIPTHLVAYGNGIWQYLPRLPIPDDLTLRALVVAKLTMYPVEFIFRNRMAGSLWKDFYQKGQPNPYGLDLPPGLRLMSPFEQTVFTPTDKSETDDPLNGAATVRRYPGAYRLAHQAYELGRQFAAQSGIEIIDGKFEVGFDSMGRVVFGDECLTPDSCRFVESEDITVGRDPAWLDKQYLREEAERIWAGGPKSPIAFSSDIIRETTLRYGRIVERLTGVSLQAFQAMRYP